MDLLSKLKQLPALLSQNKPAIQQYSKVGVAWLATLALAYFLGKQSKAAMTQESLQVSQQSTVSTSSDTTAADTSLGAKKAGKIGLKKQDSKGNSIELTAENVEDLNLQDSVMVELLNQSVEQSYALRQEKKEVNAVMGVFTLANFESRDQNKPMDKVDYKGQSTGAYFDHYMGAINTDEVQKYKGFSIGLTFTIN